MKKLILSILALLALAAPAQAVEYGLRLEGGVGIPLTIPQTQKFLPGGEVGLSGFIGITQWLDVGPKLSFVGLSPGRDIGTAWNFGGGARLKRPHDGTSFKGVSPWLDADFFYTRTGPLDCFSADVGVGLSIPVDKRRLFWLSPFVRYFSIVSPGKPGYDLRDARLLIVGLSLELGNSPLPPPKEEPKPASAPVQVVTIPVVILPPPATAPVPISTTVIIHPDHIELTEIIYFDFDEDIILPQSYGIMNELARVLKLHPKLVIEIEGHTDSIGSVEYNQKLSQRRASAVLRYLNQREVTNTMWTRAYDYSKPADTNKTKTGRKLNRRVQFNIIKE